MIHKYIPKYTLVFKIHRNLYGVIEYLPPLKKNALFNFMGDVICILLQYFLYSAVYVLYSPQSYFIPSLKPIIKIFIVFVFSSLESQTIPEFL